ncbi:F-box/kelch-repeat protein At1g57790-like [Macadamia integrifolia]|uniref:F-box/kelch-repeat protein At1g57790-like n=1 Tax=Macadamia integrifolia TaxID=60698 RepID=UPI001C4E8EF8|nr:F-box/kelch-repeat protein At1g57790-like [Macadamia integrifolia]
MLYRVRVDVLRPWSELPTETLKLIVCRLCLKDNVRLSCVCKKFGKIACSLRVVNQSPWLLYPTAVGGVIKFFDPSQGKFYVDEIPELRCTKPRCTKDGWVLFTGDRHCLLNIFTMSKVNLPYYHMLSPSFAFSCAPTSPGCVVFAIETSFAGGFDSLGVSIGICHPGDAQWTTFKFQITDVGYFNWGDGPVFCNGLFYCLSESSYNLLGVFDPQKHTWSILDVPPPNMPRHLSSAKERYDEESYDEESYDEDFYDEESYDEERTQHMVEFKGEIILVSVSYPEKPIIFKLDLSKMKWVEMKSLNGVTLFVSSHSSLAVTDVPGISSNCVYFSKRCNYGKNNYLYSFDDCKYHPAKQHHEGPFFHKAFWIKPPRKSHLLFDELY